MSASTRQKQTKRQKNNRSLAAWKARTASEILSHPPQHVGVELRHSTTLRFRATAAFSGTITFQNLLDTMLVATTATAASNLFQSVRLRRVTIWGIAAIGTSTSVSIEFAGTTTGISGDQQIHADTSMGVQPAHVDARPSARALCSNWQVNTSAVAFTHVGPAGSVIDVDLSFRGSFAGGTIAAQNAIVGGTAGFQYLRGLDGLATATSNFVPEYGPAQI